VPRPRPPPGAPTPTHHPHHRLLAAAAAAALRRGALGRAADPEIPGGAAPELAGGGGRVHLMPLAPRSEPIGGRLRRHSSSAGAAGEAAEEGEEGEDGALPQVLPQEDPGSAARDLRARLRYNARHSPSSWFVRGVRFAGMVHVLRRILGSRLVFGVCNFCEVFLII